MSVMVEQPLSLVKIRMVSSAIPFSSSLSMSRPTKASICMTKSP